MCTGTGNRKSAGALCVGAFAETSAEETKASRRLRKTLQAITHCSHCFAPSSSSSLALDLRPSSPLALALLLHRCAGLGGDCCPTAGGATLGCCGASTRSASPSSAHPGALFLELLNGQRWLLAASDPDSLPLDARWDDGTVRLVPQGAGADLGAPPPQLVLRLARVTGAVGEAAASEAELLGSRDAFPLGGEVGWRDAVASSAGGDAGEVELSFAWRVGRLGLTGGASTSPLAMVALPHHLDGLRLASKGAFATAADVTAASSARFSCLKGTDLGLVTVMVERLP